MHQLPDSYPRILPTGINLKNSRRSLTTSYPKQGKSLQSFPKQNLCFPQEATRKHFSLSVIGLQDEFPHPPDPLGKGIPLLLQPSRLPVPNATDFTLGETSQIHLLTAAGKRLLVTPQMWPPSIYSSFSHSARKQRLSETKAETTR